MQPSQSEIQREFEALRDIRRRSTSQGGPGSLIIDPDLPSQPSSSTSPLSPQTTYWGAPAPPAAASSREDAPETNDGGSNTVADDPLHLFWVPAHLHPEIAPGEFRAFLKEHARGPSDGSAVSLSRSNSASSSGLDRKKSMLSRQYRPRENDGIEEDEQVVLRRNKSGIYANSGPQLTIADLQKLEHLAEEAAKSDDPSRLRSVLRRSLSLNVPPSFVDHMDDMPDSSDDADAPIIVPPPNQILRRAARTKIRKPGLAGDGGGHRFPATRRGSGARTATSDSTAPTSDVSSSEHGDAEVLKRPPAPAQEVADADEEFAKRRDTYTEESFIYESYARDDTEDKEPLIQTTSPPPMVVERPISPPPSPPEPEPEPERPPLTPVLHHPQPQRHLSAPPHPSLQHSPRSTSPDVVSLPSSLEEHRRYEQISQEPPSFLSQPPASIDKRKDKDKKGILRQWGRDKSSKKGGKEREKESKEREKEKEKDSGFFGSLFGGGKKKQEEQVSHTLGHGGAGPATAAALLGASKSSKAYQPPLSPQLANAYARYPIHVERAVYRLSHIKLANPRRPLYEQVLISNLMFWYLGVINKTQQGPGQGQGQVQSQPAGQPGVPAAPGQPLDGMPPPQNVVAERERMEREQQEREERERAEREVMERLERERERERMEQRRESRRGSLTKAPAVGSPTAGRRAETPVRGPQYGLQHQVIEQEYEAALPPGGTAAVPLVRTASAPPPSGPPSPGYIGGYSHRPHSQSPKPHLNNAPQIPVAYSQPQNPNHYYGAPGPDPQGSQRPSGPGRPVQAHLPPGAMHSLPVEQSWIASSLSAQGGRPAHAPSSSPRTSPPLRAQSPPHHHRPPRSPPPNHYQNHDGVNSFGGAKVQGRSLSANAVAPNNLSHRNGNLNLKKKISASAVAPGGRPRTSDGSLGNEEEDVPLAVWQQQRRR